LETLLADEAERVPAALERAGRRLRDLVGEVRPGDLAGVLAARPGAGSPLAGLEDPGERESAVREWIEHAVESARLLKARLQFARKVLAEGKLGLAVTEAGPGRTDDFGLARNLIFDPAQAGPLTAPCSVPHLWGLRRVRWTDWDANTTSSLGRSVATALAGGAVFDPETYRSTVPPRNLARLDDLATGIKAPAWPEEALGKIDREKAKRGAALFEAHCAKCHGPKAADPLGDGLVALKEVGTDPNRLVNYGRKLGPGGVPQGGGRQPPLEYEEFPAALRDAVGRYLRQACRDDKMDAAEERKLEEGRPNQWRRTNGYVARELAGVWATAPYLHNGSVPTLYHLLLPAGKRPAKFPLGQRDYDPVKVGYTTAVEKPRFTFDVSKRGNSNAGHEYGTGLADEERWALVEYLKTL
jgi:mono/diheme cytochrome c family protein